MVPRELTDARPSGRWRRTRRFLLWAGLAVFTVCVAAGIWKGYQFYQVGVKNDCMQNLRSLRDCVMSVVDEENQFRLFQGSLVEAVEAESGKPFTQWAPGARELLRCPASGQLYVYRPFTGRCRREWEDNYGRPVLWCPTPAHYGGRCVLFENGFYCWVSEDEFKKALARRDKGSPRVQ